MGVSWPVDVDCGGPGTTRPELILDPATGEPLAKTTAESGGRNVDHEPPEPVEVEVPVLGKVLVKDVTQGKQAHPRNRLIPCPFALSHIVRAFLVCASVMTLGPEAESMASNRGRGPLGLGLKRLPLHRAGEAQGPTVRAPMRKIPTPGYVCRRCGNEVSFLQSHMTQTQYHKSQLIPSLGA